MTNKQELRLWAIIVMTGAAVGAISAPEMMGHRLFGVLALFASGIFLQSKFTLRMEEKWERQEQEKKSQG